jgi:hypothetical protein
LSTYAVRALRWQYLLAPLGKTHFSTAFRATVIGFAASFLLPARAGEVIRPYVLARREGLSPPAAFATIILERLLDLLVVLLLFAFFVLTAGPGVVAGDPSELARVKLGGVTALVAALAGVAFFFVMAGHPERLGQLALRLEAVLPAKLSHALAGFVRTFTQGLAVMRQPRRLFVSLLLSFPLWLSIAFGPDVFRCASRSGGGSCFRPPCDFLRARDHSRHCFHGGGGVDARKRPRNCGVGKRRR